MQEPGDVLIRIRAIAGNGMLSAAERFDRIAALVAEGRLLLPPPPQPAATREARKKSSEE